MKLEAWGLTDVGLKRKQNQDSILIDHDLGLFVVADGMGGHSGGEVASQLAVDVVQEVIRTKKEKLNEIFTPIELLREAYVEATRRIFVMGTQEKTELMGMGTTLVVAFIYQGILYVANVGDSRAYLYNGNYLWQITEDHSLVYEQMKMSKFRSISESQLLGKNIITRSVGFEAAIDVDILQKRVEPKDSLFMCSDGVCGLMSDDQLFEVLSNYPGEEVPERCKVLSCEGGGDDNISAIYIQFS